MPYFGAVLRDLASHRIATLSAERDAALRRAEAAEARFGEVEDKALRFDLDRAGIERREGEAAELVELRARLAEAERLLRFLRPAVEAAARRECDQVEGCTYGRCGDLAAVDGFLAAAPAAPSPDDGEAEAEGRLVFSCPHCGNPSATAKEGDVDIHSGATYHCGKCGGAVVFSAETPEEYTARFDRPAPAAPPPDHRSEAESWVATFFTAGPLRDAARAGIGAGAGDLDAAERCGLAARRAEAELDRLAPAAPPEPPDCPACEGEGEVHESSAVPGDEGWRRCSTCAGTRKLPTWQEIGQLRQRFEEAEADREVFKLELAQWRERFGDRPDSPDRDIAALPEPPSARWVPVSEALPPLDLPVLLWGDKLTAGLDHPLAGRLCGCHESWLIEDYNTGYNDAERERRNSELEADQSEYVSRMLGTVTHWLDWRPGPAAPRPEPPRSERGRYVGLPRRPRRAAREDRTMNRITIYGASDDLIEVEGCEGADEFNCVKNGPWIGRLDLRAPGGAMRVHCIYDGCWSFAIAQVSEDDPLPAWPVDIRQHESGYSTLVEIAAPPDTVCSFSRGDR